MKAVWTRCPRLALALWGIAESRSIGRLRDATEGSAIRVVGPGFGVADCGPHAGSMRGAGGRSARTAAESPPKSVSFLFAGPVGPIEHGPCIEGVLWISSDSPSQARRTISTILLFRPASRA